MAAIASYGDKCPLPASIVSSASNPLSQKLTNVLSIAYIDGDLADALEVLDGDEVDGAGHEIDLAGRVRRSTLENNFAVLDDYRALVDELRDLSSGIDAIKQSCLRMEKRSATVKATSAHLLQQVQDISETKARVLKRRVLLEAFLDRFLLDEEVSEVITSTGAVDEAFFSGLATVRQTRRQCQILLALDSGAGMAQELMRQTSKLEETAYAKLYRWTTQKLKNASGTALEVDHAVTRSLRELHARPALYAQCLDQVAASRQKLVVEEFVQALTRGREGARAIELTSHDPLRFVGDLLAWLHQCMASEQELLDSILHDSDQRSKSATHPTEGNAIDMRTVRSRLIDSTFSEIMPSLRQRVDAVLTQQVDREVLYKTSILIRFYRDLLGRILLPGAHMLDSLIAMEKSTKRRFSQATQAVLASARLQTPVPRSNGDLAPPDFLSEILNDARVVCATLAGSFLDTDESTLDFTEIFDAQLRHAIEICARGASDIEQPQSSVYLANCAAAVRDALEHYSFAAPQILMATEMLRRCKQMLTTEQYDFALRQSGLEPLLDNEEGGSSNEGRVSANIVDRAAAALEQFLPTAFDQVNQRLSHLADRRLATEVNTDALSRLVEAITRVQQQSLESNRPIVTSVDEAKLLLGL